MISERFLGSDSPQKAAAISSGQPHLGAVYFLVSSQTSGQAPVDETLVAVRRVPASAQRGHMVIYAARWDWYVYFSIYAESLYLLNCECQFSSSSILREPTAGVIFHAAGDASSLIHDGFKSASVSRGRITERPHVFLSWRLTHTMIPPPLIQQQSHTALGFSRKFKVVPAATFCQLKTSYLKAVFSLFI